MSSHIRTEGQINQKGIYMEVGIPGDPATPQDMYGSNIAGWIFLEFEVSDIVVQALHTRAFHHMVIHDH